MKVGLKVKDEDGKIETIKHEIEEINLLQFTEALRLVKDILKLAETDDKLQSFIDELMSERNYESESIAEDVLLRKLGGAFESLLVNIPVKAFELISILSGIEFNDLMQQKLDDVFEIYDGIIQVNDVDKLVKRAKKSFEITKKRTNIDELFKKRKTEQKQHSQKPLPLN